MVGFFNISFIISGIILISPKWGSKYGKSIVALRFKRDHKSQKRIQCGISEFRVIHGMGEGILKREVHKILREYPHIKEFSNDYHPLYGWGSTKITFK